MKKCMIYAGLAFALTFACAKVAHGQDAASAVQAQVASSQVPVTVQPAVADAPAAVVVPEPAAPPEWATEVLLSVSKLPVIGPYVSKALLYLGILAALLTTLVGAALSILATLKTGFNWAGLDKASAAIEAFRNGKIVYWLTYFSNFNAKKKNVA
ncbi:MAG: hypothetical protein OEW15_11725 [Nitrospirota bacterium]|nr:hypothetical protein [Nitrospirota bacterium]